MRASSADAPGPTNSREYPCPVERPISICSRVLQEIQKERESDVFLQGMIHFRSHHENIFRLGSVGDRDTQVVPLVECTHFSLNVRPSPHWPNGQVCCHCPLWISSPGFRSGGTQEGERKQGQRGEGGGEANRDVLVHHRSLWMSPPPCDSSLNIHLCLL